MTDAKRSLTFDALEIGEEFPPLTVSYTESDAKRIAFATDDYNAQYFTPEDQRLISPMIVANAMLAVHYQSYERPVQQTFQMKQSYRFGRLPVIGETVSIHGRVADKYSRRGIDRFDIEAKAVGEDGTTVVAGTHTYGWPRGERIKTEKTERPPTAEAEAAPEPVSVIPEASLTLTQDRITAFTGATRLNSIHTNPEVAKRAGLASTISQGAQSATFLFGRLVAWFGDDFIRCGTMNLAFIGAVPVDATIVARARTDADDHRLAVECSTTSGRTVLAGTASLESTSA